MQTEPARGLRLRRVGVQTRGRTVPRGDDQDAQPVRDLRPESRGLLRHHRGTIFPRCSSLQIGVCFVGLYLIYVLRVLGERFKPGKVPTVVKMLPRYAVA